MSKKSLTPFRIVKGDVLTKDGINYLVRCTFRTTRGRNRLIVEPLCMRGFYMVKAEVPFLDSINRPLMAKIKRYFLFESNPLEESYKYPFDIGETVWKHSGDYNAEGVVLGRFFPSATDDPYYVFSFNEPRGLLHIFRERQLIIPLDQQYVSGVYQ